MARQSYKKYMKKEVSKDYSLLKVFVFSFFGMLLFFTFLIKSFSPSVDVSIGDYKPEPEMENIEEDISFFYTNLTLDGRFVNVGENKWNLRERVTFDKVHIDMNEIYADEEEISEDDDVKDEFIPDDFDDSFDDSTGSDADINQYRNQKVDEDEEDF
mgnify:CR=1 FL=1